MPALERLLRNLYGSTPQIDLDRKLARSRAVRPLTLDFHALGDGMKRANVDLMGITLQATASIKGGTLVLAETGQVLPIAGPPPGDRGPARLTMKVTGWKPKEEVRVELSP